LKIAEITSIFGNYESLSNRLIEIFLSLANNYLKKRKLFTNTVNILAKNKNVDNFV